VLNERLRQANRPTLQPFLPLLKLLLNALYKFPHQKGVVYRGISRAIWLRILKKGTIKTWWGFSSSSTSLKVLESHAFFGHSGERTMFHVAIETGIDIRDYSAIPNENEVLLLPGTRLKVEGILKANDVTIIQMTENPIDGLIDLPRPKAAKTLTLPESKLTVRAYNNNVNRIAIKLLFFLFYFILLFLFCIFRN